MAVRIKLLHLYKSKIFTMGLSCLTNYIGAGSCSTGGTEPDSGLTIEMLPGVELQMIDKIANEQQASFSGVWADVQARAIRRFSTDVTSLFAERYKVKAITQSADLDKTIDTTTTTAAATDYRGITLELNSEDASLVDSNLQQIYVQYVYVYSDYAGSVTVKVYDLETNTQLYTKAQVFTAGWNTVKVLQSFSARRIFVAYDSTNITSVKKDLNALKNAINTGNGCDDCGAYYGLGDCIDCGVWLKGATATLADPYTITETEDSYGMSCVFSVTCSYDNIVCNNLKTFESAFLFCLGIELMDERLYSNRLNQFTLFDRNRAKELKQLFEVRYRGGITEDKIRHIGELPKIVDTINLDMADCCLEHDAPIRFATARL